MSISIIIHPNFRNGGAERSAVNSMPDLIFTYGKYTDEKFANSFANVNIFPTRGAIIKEILKLKVQKKLLYVYTNQISACYFWPLNLIAGIKVVHTQRLSLSGEIFLTKSRAKSLLVYLVFVFSVYLVKVRAPSQDLTLDFPFRRRKIEVINNVIFDGSFHYDDLCLTNKRTRDIVIISRDAPEKKLTETLNLLNEITEGPLSITIIGAKCANSFCNLNITSHPIITNKQELLELVSEHKIGVLFSAYEGFGNVIVDFIVSGVWPVINQVKWGPGEIIKRYAVGDILEWSWESDIGTIEEEAKKINEILLRGNKVPLSVSKLAFNNHSKHEV